MNAIQVLRALGPIDATSVRRDSLLRWMIVLPPGVALAARYILPNILRTAEGILGLELLPYYPPLINYALLLLAPMLVGMVIGFLLLDQRDDHTLAALRVTPLPMSAYLTYRLAVPMTISMLVTMFTLALGGLAPVSFLVLLLSGMAAAPFAPLSALALAVLAQNKVQGFALNKASGAFLMAPLVAHYVSGPLHWALSLVPTYWPAQFFWKAASGDSTAWIYLVVGVIYQSLLIALLLRRFTRFTQVA